MGWRSHTGIRDDSEDTMIGALAKEAWRRFARDLAVAAVTSAVTAAIDAAVRKRLERKNREASS